MLLFLAGAVAGVAADRATELQSCGEWGRELRAELEPAGFELADIRQSADAEVVLFLNRETGVLEMYGAAMTAEEVALATKAGLVPVGERAAADGRDATIMHKSVRVEASAGEET